MPSDNKILLSVAVPTYNRPDKFRKMLSGLLPQLTSETELVIRDDSPNGETKKVLDELIQKFNPPCKVSYFHGEKIGLDAANLFLLEHSKGKYMWWFSDDDEFMPGAIAKVTDVVKKHQEITFMFINYGFGKIEVPAVNKEDLLCSDGKEILNMTRANIGLLSALFFKRESALPSLPLMRKHLKGFSFAGLVPVFYVLSSPGGFYFLRGPYVLHVPETEAVSEGIKNISEKGGGIKNEYFSYFGVDFYLILKEFEGGFGRGFVKKILASNFSSLWRGMLVGWVGGWDTPRGKRWKMFKLYWSFPEFWIAMPMFLLPLWLNKALYRLYKVFFSHRRFRFAGSTEK